MRLLVIIALLATFSTPFTLAAHAEKNPCLKKIDSKTRVAGRRALLLKRFGKKYYNLLALNYTGETLSIQVVRGSGRQYIGEVIGYVESMKGLKTYIPFDFNSDLYFEAQDACGNVVFTSQKFKSVPPSKSGDFLRIEIYEQ